MELRIPELSLVVLMGDTDNIADFCRFDTELLLKTPYKIVNLDNAIEEAEAPNWWLTQLAIDSIPLSTFLIFN